MPEILTFVAVFLIGFIASVIGAMVGGGSLLSIPFLIFIGLPPQMAIATDRFGGIGAATSALFKFGKAKKIAWKYVPILAILSFVGSLIGANILLSIDPRILQRVAGFLLLFLLPFVFLKKDIGVQQKKLSKLKRAFGCLVYLFIQTFTGFFGAGTGPFIFYTLMIGFGLTIVEAVATQTIPFLILSISSLIVFATHGLINYQIGIALLFGMSAGGYVGAHIALTKGSAWVKRLFAVIIIVAGIKLLFF